MAKIFQPSPSLPPPVNSVGAVAWIRRNLLSSPLNILLSVFSVYLVYLLIPPIVSWAFINATWVGESRAECAPGGACWAFVNVRFNQFMYGLYPAPEYWR
ncbi:amino acid ABC transporter permease, partial [Marinomonas sp. 42_23_T18]